MREVSGFLLLGIASAEQKVPDSEKKTWKISWFRTKRLILCRLTAVKRLEQLQKMADLKTKSPSEMAEALGRTEAFLIKQKKLILIVVGAIIVIVGGALLYHNFVAVPQENKASTAIAKGQEYFAQGDWQKALNGDGAGFAGFLSLSKQYSSTKAGNLAKLYAGISLYNSGKAQEALKYLKDYSTAGDEMIEAEAIGAIGDCYATLGQNDNAVESFKKAASKADNNSLSPVYLIKAGEILESQGKYDDAIALYTQVKDNYAQSALSQEIDKYIERATVKK
jgi:tetratricopeptide (TPR) repeat protein